MRSFTIDIDLDAKCDECGEGGAVGGGRLCLGCISKAVEGKPMRSERGKAYAHRVRSLHRPSRGRNRTR